ncbi:MAG: hypothetical protein CMJ46_08430, partial [Planctomyces sp.]|nr:hypothetical protein [Planctomyces sp.]
MRLILAPVVLLLTLAASTLSAAELRDQVVIRRTAYGVPHIVGESERAVAYGFAWAQCEDHFSILYKSIVRGRSEMSRYYGASEANVRFDFDTKLLRARETAVNNYHLLPADFREVVSGFVEGVNDYIEAHPEETEDWMTPVSVHDLVSAWQVAIMRFTFLRYDYIGRLRKAAAEEGMALLQEMEQLREPETEIGSNTIALAPSRTTSGNAMLLNNPHQPWSEEANYYEAHITIPGQYDFYGSTFVGGAFLTTGFNRHLGWSHTVNHPDLFELYQVKLDPEQPDHYLFDNSSVPLETREVTVATDDGRTLNDTFQWSPLGPVVFKTTDSLFILRSVAFDQYQTGVQWYRMSQATSFDEFKAALEMQAIPMFNVAYADRAGNIYYLWNGTVPVIPHKNHRFTPVKAETSDEIWTRIHPVADLMQLKNPKGGYVQNCNSPPYFTNLHEPLNREEYPPYFPDNDLSVRTQHGLSLVHNNEKFSLEDLADLKFSMKMMLADRMKPGLVGLLNEAQLSDEEQQAVQLLEDWDNSASAESRGSVLFKVWWDHYSKGDDKYVESWDADRPTSTPYGIGSPERAVDAFKAAIKVTKEQWGSWDVAWGDVHRIRIGDVDLPIGGGSGLLGCFRVCDYREADDGKLVI